jgi:RNA polymerase sigma-70 factor (ECF subfamily)
VVLAAGDSASPDYSEALEKLCRTYWFPLYADARRAGHSAEDAQDLTQSFFMHLLNSRLVASADAARGRFRSFLRQCFRNFSVAEHAKATTRKRGGGQPIFSLDAVEAEARFGRELADPRNTEQAYERDWALAVLEETMCQVREEFAQSNRLHTFEVLRLHLEAEDDGPSYAVSAGKLGTTEGTVRVMVHRLRRRYREVLNEVVLRTVGSPGEVDEELRHLLRAVQGQPCC